MRPDAAPAGMCSRAAAIRGWERPCPIEQHVRARSIRAGVAVPRFPVVRFEPCEGVSATLLQSVRLPRALGQVPLRCRVAVGPDADPELCAPVRSLERFRGPGQWSWTADSVGRPGPGGEDALLDILPGYLSASKPGSDAPSSPAERTPSAVGSRGGRMMPPRLQGADSYFSGAQGVEWCL